MSQPDLYEILGVNKNATDDEIRNKYLKLAHKYHPDKTGGNKESEDKLKEINAAYDILKKPDKRAQYDQFGQSGDFSFSQHNMHSGMADVFESIFGGIHNRNALHLAIRITLEDAFEGATKNIKFDRLENCNTCSGSGAASGSNSATCSFCRGNGTVSYTHLTLPTKRIV